MRVRKQVLRTCRDGVALRRRTEPLVYSLPVPACPACGWGVPDPNCFKFGVQTHRESYLGLGIRKEEEEAI